LNIRLFTFLINYYDVGIILLTNKDYYYTHRLRLYDIICYIYEYWK